MTCLTNGSCSLQVSRRDALCLEALRQAHTARHAVACAVVSCRGQAAAALVRGAEELALLSAAPPGRVSGAGRVRQLGEAIGDALIWAGSLALYGTNEGAQALGRAVIEALRRTEMSRELTRHFSPAAADILEGVGVEGVSGD